MNIVIDESRGEVKVIDRAQVTKVSADDFYEYCLNQLIVNKNDREEAERIGTGYFGNADGDHIIATAVYDDLYPDHNRYVIELQAKRRNLLIESSVENCLITNVGCPRTIIAVDVQQERMKDIFVYCLKNDGVPVNKNTLLYPFPFGNIEPNARLCTGSIKKSYDLENPGSLVSALENILYNSSFNDDYNSSGISLIKELSGNDFSDRLLLKAAYIAEELV